eukprot:scaffold4347_cov269-Ochromonas_danica.AAC.20
MASKDYCHFNDNDDNTNFHLSLFGYHLTILQSPGDRQLGHGAVVWDASVVFAKYMENNLRDFSPSKLNGQQVLELGSGCGLAGGAYLLRGAQVTFTDLQPVLTSLTIPNTTPIEKEIVIDSDSDNDNDRDSDNDNGNDSGIDSIVVVVVVVVVVTTGIVIDVKVETQCLQSALGWSQ